eukprot:TRINITY_DN70281_c0_g1_i1.p1 TRINITY_DN70281_c0_g1~~TRINITY_DN70281_c0_g1_i1.p1  ORF type:complete len:697 (-),score=84.12 TRINITY_DN70281_c0_g1_i1:200-2056(-)
MPTYECESYSSAKIDTSADGTKTLFFEASLASGSACGEASCQECTKYRSCAGPFLQTTPITMPAGSSVQWEWLATGQVDWYEVVVAVYSINQSVIEVVDSDLNLLSSNMVKLESVAFQRGATTEWVKEQLVVHDEGTFFVRFHLGSYDETGGGMVGAEMKVRNFQFLYPATATSTSTMTTTRTLTSIVTTSTTTGTATTETTTTTSTTTCGVIYAPSVACDECTYWPWLLVGFLAGLVLGAFIAWLCLRPRTKPKVLPEVELPPDPPVETVVHEEPVELPEEPVVEVVEEKEPDPDLDIERVLILLYPTLKAIFQFYSSAGTVGDGDLFRMNLKQWLQLLNDCKLDVSKTRAEIIFKECVRDGRAAKKVSTGSNILHVHRSDCAELDGMVMQSKRSATVRASGVEEEKDLGYAEFVNALLRLGWDSLPQPARVRARDGGPRDLRAAVGKGLWALVEDKVRPHAGRFDGCISLRQAVEAPPAKGTLAKLEGDTGAFGKAFKTYHDNKTGHMLLSGFDLWARHSGLHKRLSMPKLRECFVWAGDKDRGKATEGSDPSSVLSDKVKVFTGPDYSRDEKLTRHEFALACARIAYIIKGLNESEPAPESLSTALADFSQNMSR